MELLTTKLNNMKKIAVFLIILTTSCATMPQDPEQGIMHYVDGLLVSSECQNCDEVD